MFGRDTENGWSEISEVLPNTQPGRQGRQEPSGRSVEQNSRLSYIETIYHTVLSLVRDLTPSIYKTYGDLRAGVLCRDFAAHRCYKETI